MDYIDAVYLGPRIPPNCPHCRGGWLWGTSEWMDDNQYFAIGLSIFYLIGIYFLRNFMDKREAFDLRTLLGIWDIILSVFSIVGSYYVLPALWIVISEHGLSYEMCGLDSEVMSPWVFFFIISKIPEFVDTLFLLLRKRELSFLHWFHHWATFLFCWYAWAHRLENGGVFAGMNLFVHSIMYAYFGSAALGFRWPEFFRPIITCLQISQMLFGIAMILHNIMVCNFHPQVFIAGLIMYSVYAYLFVKFFVKEYCVKKDKVKEVKAVKKD